MAKKNRIILIDADVVSHFITGQEIYTLPTIFPYKMKILDKVYDELENFKSKKTQVDNLINQKILEIMPFPDDSSEIRKEYYWIKKQMFKGDGESATLAVTRYSNDIVGSSNLKDIKSYCVMHSIDYLSTMDFLCRALETGKMDLARCNNFITNVLKSGSKLPVKSMAQHTCREINL
jgi:hypothetical protein